MKKQFYFTILLLMLSLTSCKSHFSETEHPMDKVFSLHETKQLRKHQMKLIAAGTPDETNIHTIALHYIVFKKMKIPEARKLAISSIEDFLELVNADEDVQKKLKKNPITYKDLRYNIGFGTSEGRFQEYPYVAHLYLDEGILHYCYDDELFGHFTDEEDFKEPYETALNILNQQRENSQ